MGVWKGEKKQLKKVINCKTLPPHAIGKKGVEGTRKLFLEDGGGLPWWHSG